MYSSKHVISVALTITILQEVVHFLCERLLQTVRIGDGKELLFLVSTIIPSYETGLLQIIIADLNMYKAAMLLLSR